MLLAKLKLPVEKIYQLNGLNTENVTAEYLAVSVMNYTMGEILTNFYYKLGKVEFDEQGDIIDFNPVIRGYVDIDSKDIENWGTDDFVALQAVAKALGVEIEDTPLIYKGLFKA